MTNEQKAVEISQQWWGCGKQQQITAYESAMEALEWKDKELKNYLDELLTKLNACEKDRTREATVVEIIKGHFFKNIDLI